MTKSKRVFWLAVMGSGILLTAFVLIRDVVLSGSRSIVCADGPRQTIDIRDFVTKYSRYSAEFEASVTGQGKLVGKLEPIQLESLTEAAQQANEFRKYLVAGYNGCAVSAGQYADFGVRFQALDGLARQIDRLSSKTSLDATDRSALSGLVRRYVAATQELAASR